MMVNWKKLILPNIPYFFIGLFATKLGQAIRLAPGSDLSGKIMHFVEGMVLAFESSLPSFHPADLCVGIAVALGIRLAVYIKGKNAKKFRKDMEYGSARWGGYEDIKPYIDPVFANNIILTQTESLTMRQMDGGVLESAAVEESPIKQPLAAARTEIMELEGIKPETVIYQDIALLEQLVDANAVSQQPIAEAISTPDYEKQFLESPGDMVAIYQLRHDAPAGLRFERFDDLKEPPDPIYYECTYALKADPDIPRGRLLEQQYMIFNIQRPDDFTGQSLSVSDIVALKRNGLISYHYCDWVGYKELDHFKPQECYPASVEQILSAPEPDPYCNRHEMLEFGYTDQNMYPISTDFALELMERDVPVYMLFSDNTEAMAFDNEDLAMHKGHFGVSKEDWNEVKENPDIVAIKRHFAVDYLQDRNEDRIRQLSQTNPLKNAEISMEDDYGMIDGIINNGKAPGKEEPNDKKPSVIEQLKNQPQQSRKKSTQKKNKEKEL